MSKILLVEDTTEIFDIVKRTLGFTYSLSWARTVAETQRLIAKKEFELILLDIGLPDGDGFRVCSILRADEKHKNVPVVFLSGRTNVQDQVLAFSVGADDYVPKPFDSTELRARVEAKLRKRQYEKASSQMLRIGDIEINKETQKVYVYYSDQPREVDLTPLEFKILLQLVKVPNAIFSRERLLGAIWGENVHVHARSIDTHVSKLRRKLGQRADSIASVHGAGYRFVTDAINLSLGGQ